MRTLTIFLCILALCAVGCAGTRQGPGANEACAEAETNPAGQGQAAAAAASGGQEANQAPFAEDTARLSPQTTIGRGQGATTSNSADSEKRHVASGGAQNLGVVVPALANASNLGGVSPAISEAAKTAAATRGAWACASQDPSVPTEKLLVMYQAMKDAQEALNAAQSTASVTHVTNNNFQESRIQQFGISTSSTNKDGEAIDPEVVEPMARAAAELGTAGLTEYEEVPSTLPVVPVVPDSLPEVPVAPLPPAGG